MKDTEPESAGMDAGEEGNAWHQLGPSLSAWMFTRLPQTGLFLFCLFSPMNRKPAPDLALLLISLKKQHFCCSEMQQYREFYQFVN